jgi:hypothetical protein
MTSRGRLAAVLLVASACSPGSPAPATEPAPPATITIASAAPAPAQPETTAAPKASATSTPERLAVAEWKPSQSVSVRGRVSKIPWQHLMTNVPGKRPEYFDIDQSRQIVVYTAKPLECPGEIELEGIVLEVTGPTKRPSKTGETFRTLQLDVTASRCLP